MEYQEDYTSFHPVLLAFVRTNFREEEAGLQGDSWIWITDAEGKVAIDTFTSMKHQIKSSKPGAHVRKVIEILRQRYKVNVYDKPELEAHEG